MVVAGAILAWALTIGVLPGLDVLPHLPQVDWSWPLDHKREALIIAAVWIAVLAMFAVIGIRRAREFKARVRQGFAIFGTRWAYLTQVAQLAAALLGLPLRLGLLLPEGLHRAGDAAQRAARPRRCRASRRCSRSRRAASAPSRACWSTFSTGPSTGIAGTLLLSFSVGMYIAVTIENVVIGFIALFLMVGTLRWKRVVPDEEEAYARGP